MGDALNTFVEEAQHLSSTFESATVFSLATTVFLQFAIFQMDFVTALPAVAWFILLILMYALECLVAFLQAYVFTILSASYIGMATHPH